MALVKMLQGLFLLVLAAALSVGSLLASSAIKWAQELPSLDDLDAYEFTATSQVFAGDGLTKVGVILPAESEDGQTTNRLPVSLDQVSPAALEAIVAYEDDQFFNHYGFDVPGILRAFYEEFLGDSGRGGSTITTQVIKNTVLQDLRTDRSLERKAKEVLLAVELERRLTKAEVLQRYVNVVFWGGNLYGIRAAAQTYFDKDPIGLTLAEGLYLARLIPAPNERHGDLLGTRASMREVLDKMVRQGTISRDAAERAWRQDLQPRGWRVVYDGEGNVVSAERTEESINFRTTVSSDRAGFEHVMLAVRSWLLDKYGYSVVFGSGGLKVYTTIDLQAQRAAIEASERAEVPPGAQLAIVVLDPQTGEVLAMVGEKLTPGVKPKDLNRVTQAYRQPGSSFKPIVYATAIEQGGFSQAQVLLDAPASFPQRGQPPYEPLNWDKRYDGFQTVREHLNRSRNIPAVKALEAATPEAVAIRARELGYDVEPYYALALGSFVATPLQHASAFSAFTNEGVQVEAHFIARVEDADGNVLFEADPRRSRVWSPQTAYVMLDVLHGNVADATGLATRARIDGRWVTGKTGTTNDDRDIWFVGATPGLVATVWIGNDDNSPLPGRIDASLAREDGRVTSSRQPIYVWKDAVEGALRGRPANADGYPVPEGVTFYTFDRKTGALDPDGTRGAFTGNAVPTREGFLPELLIEVPIDKRTGKRATSDTPPDQLEIRKISPDEIAEYAVQPPSRRIIPSNDP